MTRRYRLIGWALLGVALLAAVASLGSALCAILGFGLDNRVDAWLLTIALFLFAIGLLLVAGGSLKPPSRTGGLPRQ